MADSDRDLFAIQEDALLLDIVATRGDLTSFADDPIAAVLGSWTRDIDAGLESQQVAHLLTAPAPAASVTPMRSGRSARFLVAATTAVVLVGTSGVAAAVTGDPLGPFRAAVGAVTGSGNDNLSASGVGNNNHPLPDPAATEAEINRTLSGVNRAVAQGDLAAAQALLDAAEVDAVGVADLAPGFDVRFEHLQDKIDQASQDPTNNGHPVDNGQSDEHQGGQTNNGHQGGGKPDHPSNGNGGNSTGNGGHKGHPNDNQPNPNSTKDKHATGGGPGSNRPNQPNQPNQPTDHPTAPTDDATKPGQGGTTKGRPDQPQPHEHGNRGNSDTAKDAKAQPDEHGSASRTR
ncbi:MAG: hypothetical protein ABI586_02675 [Candidatus Nanopelagicales bacterium]